MTQGGELVRQTLQLLLDNWDRTPVRVVQDGLWQNLYLSEIADQRLVAEQVISFLRTRHLPVEEPDPPQD